MRVVIAFAVGLVAACSRAAEPVTACTLIGCESGLEVRIEPAPAGTFRVEVRAPADPTLRVFECPSAGQCNGRAFFADFTPDSVAIRVIVGADTVERAVRPTYRTTQPNGPACPPTCRQVEVQIDVGTANDNARAQRRD